MPTQPTKYESGDDEEADAFLEKGEKDKATSAAPAEDETKPREIVFWLVMLFIASVTSKWVC